MKILTVTGVSFAVTATRRATAGAAATGRSGRGSCVCSRRCMSSRRCLGSWLLSRGSGSGLLSSSLFNGGRGECRGVVARVRRGGAAGSGGSTARCLAASVGTLARAGDYLDWRLGDKLRLTGDDGASVVVEVAPAKVGGHGGCGGDGGEDDEDL